MSPNDADGMANSVDPDQTAPDLGLHCLLRPVSVRKLRIITVCVFQGSALKKLGMVGRHNILFCQNILYRNCIFRYIFPHFSADLTTFCSQFTIKCLGSGQKPK